MNQRWGQAEFPDADVPVEELSTWQTFTQAVAVGEGLVSALSDKYKAMLNAERKLRDAQAMGASTAYIQRLQVNYDSAKRAYQKQLAAEQSTQQYRLLGQLGLVSLIGVSAATIFFILTRALRKPSR